jgi:hypothetical protein
MTDPYLAHSTTNKPAEAVTKLKKLLADQGYWKYGLSGGKWSPSLTEAVIYFQQTHIGQDGQPLKADGKVGDKTWWALRHPSGKAQKSNLAPLIPSGLPLRRQEILAKATAEHARKVKEVPSGYNRGPHVDKYFPAWLRKKWPDKKTKGVAWCAYFVNWIATEVMGKRPWGGYIGSCFALYNACKEKGLAIYSGHERVRPGDLGLMFKTNPDKNHQQSGHAFLVLRVSEDGSEINTVEGNCGNRVKIGWRKTRDVSRFVNFCGDVLPTGTWERGVIKADDVGSHGTR